MPFTHEVLDQFLIVNTAVIDILRGMIEILYVDKNTDSLIGILYGRPHRF